MRVSVLPMSIASMLERKVSNELKRRGEMPFACLRVKILPAIGSNCKRHVDSVVVNLS